MSVIGLAPLSTLALLALGVVAYFRSDVPTTTDRDRVGPDPARSPSTDGTPGPT